MSDQINVTGLDQWALLAALHNASRVSPTMVCKIQARGDITADEARDETQKGVRDEWLMRDGVPFWSDYLFGRPIKAFLRREGEYVILVRTDLYDRAAGPGAAQRVVIDLRMMGGEA